MTRAIPALLAALLAAPFASGAAADEAGSWMPLEPGRSWTYAYARESVERTADALPEQETFRGRLFDRIEGPASAGFGPGSVELISTLRGRLANEPIEMIETRRAVLEPDGLGYRILALDAAHPVHGGLRLVRYDPPLQQLGAEPREGARWPVGAFDLGGLETRLEGRVVGLEDADTGEGRFPDCLVVRYRGDLRGGFDTYEGRVEVESGTVVVTEWLARGLGVVKAVEDVEQRVVLPDGSRATLSEHVEYALTGHEAPDGAAPASR